MTGQPAAQTRYRSRLAVLLTTVVGVNIGYTAVLPFLPQIVRSLSLTPADLAAFFTAFAVVKALAQPIGGRLTDRHGGAAVTAAALVVAAAGIVLVAEASGPVMAIAGRVVWGLGDGLTTPALYQLTAVLARQNGRAPASAYAKLGAAAVSAFGLGPLIVGIVHPFADFRTVLLGAALLTVVNAVVAWAALRATEKGAPAEPTEKPLEVSVTTGRRWWVPVAAFGLFDLFANFLWSALEPLVPLLAADHDPGEATGRSAIVLSVGMFTFVVATLGLSRLPERMRTPGWGLVTLIALAISCVALTWLPLLPVALAAIVVFMVAQAQVYLIARDGLQRYSGGSGQAWGLFGLFADGGFILGPLAAIYTFQTAQAATFAVFGGVCLLAVAVFAVVFRVLLSARMPAVAGVPATLRAAARQSSEVP